MSDENDAERQEIVPEAGEGTNDAPGAAGGDQDAPETFSREYVEALRRENAELRVRAKRHDETRQRLLEAEMHRMAGSILEDPEDLWRDREVDDFLGPDGLPDPEVIERFAHELAATKPHLARRRPTGSVDQGAREERREVSLAEMLRQRAG